MTTEPINEIWVPFKDCPHYIISNTGRLINKNTSHERKLSKQGSGYFGFTLFRGKKSYSIHRSVANHFIANPLNLPEVNHKDGNKSNNNYWNLEWVTSKQNKDHAHVNGLISRKGEKNSGHKLTDFDVIEILQLSKMYGLRPTITAIEYSVTCGTICEVLNGNSWKHIPR